MHRTASGNSGNKSAAPEICGPFTADNGNRYIAIDIRSGKSLQQLIDNGWENIADRGVFRNNLLIEILGILIKLTHKLNFLHDDCRIFHPDLSPAGIYISYINVGLDTEPAIIDYSSACDLNDPQNQRTGSSNNVVSDTYRIAEILFYAVLGEQYTAEKIYNPSWKQKIRQMYPVNVYDSFADQLIHFFDNGLSADPTERYVTLRTSMGRKQEYLLKALTNLQEIYRNKTSDILSAIQPDELMSYLILDKYPLYQYCSSDGNLHVLCLASGIFTTQMILSILGTGQMIGKKLYIHVVSGNTASYREHLCSRAPLLKEYADFGDGSPVPENIYVSFTFETVSDLTDASVCRKTAEKYGPECRYVIISLGTTNNAALAKQFACEIGTVSAEKTIINYYQAEDTVQSVCTGLNDSALPSHVDIQPFGNRLASYSKDVNKLGQKAFRVHYLYEKLYNPKASRNQALKSFLAESYSQRSSTATAVHIDYKLASLGISLTDPKTSHRSVSSYRTKIIEKYNRCLQDPVQYGKLLQLEHMRWMFFMIADRYQLPDENDHERYSFKTVFGKFNKWFKCTEEKIKLHHCLVPCDAAGLRLPDDRREWDKYSSKEKIDNTDYDPLDKMSLYVHMLAGQRMKRRSIIGKIRSLVENELQDMLYAVPDNSALHKEYHEFDKWISQVLLRWS